MNIFINLASLMGPLRPPEYLGPDVLLPLWGILASIVGFFLIFWRLIVRLVKMAYRKLRGLPDEVPPEMDVEDPTEEDTDN
jgi:hypothetical protein